MANKSKIEWCDATWNPITGCTPVSDGCTNCYAKRMVERFPKAHGERAGVETGTGKAALNPIPFSSIVPHYDRLDQPMCWKRPRRIFVCSMGDLFHEDLALFEETEKIFEVISACYKHTFMVLTKRPQRMRAAVEHYLRDGFPYFPNLWLGVTTENQEAANRRIPILLQTPAAVRFVSVEPMLGPIDLKPFFEWTDMDNERVNRGPHWVICGGESGPGARPMNPLWVQDLRDQCASASVPFFFKQWGEWVPTNVYAGPKERLHMWSNPFHPGQMMERVGKKAAGCLLDGCEHKKFPEVIA